MTLSAARPLGVLRALLSRYWAVLLLLLTWQLGVAISGVNRIVLPRPLDVLRDIAAEPRLFAVNASLTLLLATGGLLLGMAFGTAVAILAWSSRLLGGLLAPLTILVSSVPVVTLIPILARLFGYGAGTTLAIVCLITALPAYVFTQAGLASTSDARRHLATAFGASPWRRFVWVILPGALPGWTVGLRLAAPPAILSAMVAEFLIGTAGLGYLLRSAAAELRTDRAFATSLIATVLSIASFALAAGAERRVLARWR